MPSPNTPGIVVLAFGLLGSGPVFSLDLDYIPEQTADLDRPEREAPPLSAFLTGLVGVAPINTGRFIGSDDRVTAPLPLVYLNYNDRLFWSVASLGGWLYRSDNLRVRVGLLAKARGGIDGERAPYSRINDRDPSIDAGLNVAWRLDPVVIGLSWMADTLGRNHGQSVSARLSWPIGLSDRWRTTPSIGAEWQDERLVDYYYGVSIAETGGGAPLYAGRADFQYRAAWSVTYRISRRWGAVGGISYTRLGSGLGDSPIVSRDDNLLVFGAVFWSFFVHD